MHCKVVQKCRGIHVIRYMLYLFASANSSLYQRDQRHTEDNIVRLMAAHTLYVQVKSMLTLFNLCRGIWVPDATVHSDCHDHTPEGPLEHTPRCHMGGRAGE